MGCPCLRFRDAIALFSRSRERSPLRRPFSSELRSHGKHPSARTAQYAPIHRVSGHRARDVNDRQGKACFRPHVKDFASLGGCSEGQKPRVSESY